MRHLTLRASDDLLKRLDELRTSRGLPNRSAALRLAIREAVPAATKPDPLDQNELLSLLSERARDGSVPAMRLLWQILRGSSDVGQESDPLAQLDELAVRRRGTQGGTGAA